MHSPLEQYLEQVKTHLQEMPQQQREEEVEEIRQHIGTMVAAHRELGATDEVAIMQALAQFGKAQALGSELARAFRRRDRILRGSLLGATAFSCAAYWALIVMHTLCIPAFHPSPAGMTMLSLLWVGTMYALPLLQGCLTAMATPRKAVQGVALSWAVIYLVSWITMSRSGCMPAEIYPQQIVLGVTIWLIYTAFAMLAAKVSVQVMADRSRRRRVSTAG